MTRICRFNDDRLGLVAGDMVHDVTPALEILPSNRWPEPAGDLLIANLPAVLARAGELAASAPRLSIQDVVFRSPVANPSKIVAAPVNYRKHHEEALADRGVNFAADVKTIDHYGLFLKANSSLVGFGDGVELVFPARRTDHEIELVAVIGRGGRDIAQVDALSHVAGYALGLDMTVRGPEDRSLRKSLDGFSVLGPWLTTADEVPDPGALRLWLAINGAMKQDANTSELIFDTAKLIAYASTYYTLHPGDLIFTGTPEGVGPVIAGDRIACGIDRVGQAETAVRIKTLTDPF